MGTNILGNIGAEAGALLPVPFGRRLGRMAGTAIGRHIAAEAAEARQGTDVAFLDLALQTSAYGKTIPLVYGTVRLAGNVIWALPIREETRYAGSGGGKGGGAPRSSSKTVSRFATLAVALCEGKAARIERVWADDRLVDPARLAMRFYDGSETQAPDSVIEAAEGVGNAPAYRGLCYVVLEDIPLAEYGNRVPNFTFEVTCLPEGNGEGLPDPEELITAVTLIPGAGEYVYDTVTQYHKSVRAVDGTYLQEGYRRPINQNNHGGTTDAFAALDLLEATFPNLEWVSVVITWFGTSVDAGACEIWPGVEFAADIAVTEPDPWEVAGFSRGEARLVMQDAEGNPQYGGTPSDAGLVRFVDEIKARGYQVMAYPMMFMDVESKPWRGRITGEPADVAGFFHGTRGYNDFILHYANLLEGKVDAFVIGSELVGLTGIRETSDDSFPAVDELVALAGSVKAILGTGVVVTYAADWSEYHHTEGGFYHLDPLWASPAIDVVGIDAYFPLTDTVEENIAAETIEDGWFSGEGYDWYYADEERTEQLPLAPEYAWKNIAWWHGNAHYNPGGAPTSWVPGSKPIWFTEYGFPSVDGASNQPNVFYDPNSIEGGLPRFSRGDVDFYAQRRALSATESAWQGSALVTNRFVWTWDARPYPVWPDRADLWADAGLWAKGHWVQGKLGRARVGNVVADLFRRAGLSPAEADASGVTAYLEGMAISRKTEIGDVVGMLQRAYGFNVLEADGRVVAADVNTAASADVPKEEILETRALTPSLREARGDAADAPSRLHLSYMDRARLYESGARHAFSDGTEGTEASVRLPLVLDGASARTLAERLLAEWRAQREERRFVLPLSYIGLTPGDTITLSSESGTETLALTEIAYDAHGRPEALASAFDPGLYAARGRPAGEEPENGMAAEAPAAVLTGESAVYPLQLPLIPGVAEEEDAVYLAVAGTEAGWPGAAVFVSKDGGAQYRRVGEARASAVVGKTATALAPSFRTATADEMQTLDVSLIGDHVLEGVSEEGWLAGENVVLIGQEILLFREAQALAPSRYRLSGLMRGAFGTEGEAGSHPVGTDVVVPGGALVAVGTAGVPYGASLWVKAVTFGTEEDAAPAYEIPALRRPLRPYAPVHLSCQAEADGDLAFAWTRRTRQYGTWQDGADVPLSEAREAYRVLISNAAEDVLREEEVSSPSYLYTAAKQSEDGIVPGDYYMDVAQLSDEAGAGAACRTGFTG
jgi:hypothetical protein